MALGPAAAVGRGALKFGKAVKGYGARAGAKAVQAGADLTSGKTFDTLQQGFTGFRRDNWQAKYAPALLGGGIVAGAVGYQGYKGIEDALTGGPEREGYLRDAMQERLNSRIQEIQQRRLEEAMLASASRLAAANPQLYNEIMAGRRLPLGAMVLGGQPRVDLMEQLAMDMAQGEYTQPPGPDAELAQLLGTG